MGQFLAGQTINTACSAGLVVRGPWELPRVRWQHGDLSIQLFQFLTSGWWSLLCSPNIGIFSEFMGAWTTYVVLNSRESCEFDLGPKDRASDQSKQMKFKKEHIWRAWPESGDWESEPPEFGWERTFRTPFCNARCWGFSLRSSWEYTSQTFGFKIFSRSFSVLAVVALVSV